MSLDFLHHTEAESSRFLRVLADTDPDRPVPTCDKWTAADLLWHLGEVQHFWGAIVGQRLAGPESYERPTRPDAHAGLVEFFADATTTLIDALRSTPPETAAWTWHEPDQTVGFINRRQAHEALIHRLDAELTVGAPTPLNAELATDGISEVFQVILGGPPGWADVAPGGSNGRLTATDTDAGWLVRVTTFNGTSPTSGTTYVDEPCVELLDTNDDDRAEPPAFSVNAKAGDLDAWLWNRLPADAVSITGDADTFATIIKHDVQ